MSNKYTRIVEKVGDYDEDIAIYEDMGYVAYELPKDVILMVHRDAPSKIISAATEAQKGDHDAYLDAIRDTTAWEYKIESVQDLSNPNNIQEICNKNGEKGWELVPIIHSEAGQCILFFKKQID
jgi:hypothetical protein